MTEDKTDINSVIELFASLSEHWQDVLNIIAREGNTDDIPDTLSPKDVVDKSGPSSPFEVRVYYPDSLADEKVVVGQDRTTLVSREGDDAEETVPLSKGRSDISPGIIIQSKGLLTLDSQDVIDLWDEASVASGDESPSGYQTGFIYMDFTDWDGSDTSNTSQFYNWMTMPFTSTNKEYLNTNSGSILPLAYVTARNSEGTAGDDDYIPRKIVSILGLCSDSVVYLTSGGSSRTLAKTTGSPTAGEYPVDFYENGKHEAATDSGTIEVLNLCLTEELPVGTWVVATKITSYYTGGTSSVSP